MKTLLFSFLAAFMLISTSSCTVSDPTQEERQITGDNLTVTINGVEKTFNTVTITEESGDPVNNISDVLSIVATIDNLPDEIIRIDLFSESTGDDVVYMIQYVLNGQLYYLEYDSNVGENTEDDLSLSFSGNIWDLNQGSQEKEISFLFTNGSLNATRL